MSNTPKTDIDDIQHEFDERMAQSKHAIAAIFNEIPSQTSELNMDRLTVVMENLKDMERMQNHIYHSTRATH